MLFPYLLISINELLISIISFIDINIYGLNVKTAAHTNVTNFLHINFLSILWRARGGVNDIVPACND